MARFCKRFEFVRALKHRCGSAGIFQQRFSVCCAGLISPNNGETAVSDYNSSLFWVLSVSLDVLKS